MPKYVVARVVKQVDWITVDTVTSDGARRLAEMASCFDPQVSILEIENSETYTVLGLARGDGIEEDS